MVSCSLVSNKYSNPSDVIYCFAPTDTTYGSIISTSPTFPQFIDIADGVYGSFTITFRDQDYSKLAILDTNLVIMLVIRNKKDGM
jgi:hypothetical protein